MTLYTIPWAGGAAHTYYSWKGKLDQYIHLTAYEYPGHYSRKNEPFAPGIIEIAQDFVSTCFTGDEPYCVFGHSMGAYVGYEVCRILTDIGCPPSLIILSGAYPPNIIQAKDYSGLDEAAFRDAVSDSISIPECLMSEHAYIDHVYSLLRKDFQTLHQYKNSGCCKLNGSVKSAIFSASDDIEGEALVGWEQLLDSPAYFTNYTGGHFYLTKCCGEVCERISALMFNL